MTDQLSKKKTIAFALLTFVVVVAALAGAAEFAVRYRERHRSTVPGSFPFLVYQHRTLLFSLVHNEDYFGWISTDSSGFRRGLSRPHSPDAIQIIADGASTTFDFGVSRDDRTWPARLEYWLHQLAPAVPVEVRNAGVPGFQVWQNVSRLQRELYAYQPDLIILLAGHNDLSHSLAGGRDAQPFEARPDEVRCLSAPRRWLLRHSLFYAKVSDRLGAIGRRNRDEASVTKSKQADVIAQRLTSGQASFERDVRFYLASAKSLNVPVVIPALVHVSRPTDTTAAEPEATSWRNISALPAGTILDGYRRFNESLRRVSAEYGDVFIDTAPFGVNGTRFYVNGDPMHFNDAGADLMARKLAEALIASGLLTKRTGPRT